MLFGLKLAVFNKNWGDTAEPASTICGKMGKADQAIIYF